MNSVYLILLTVIFVNITFYCNGNSIPANYSVKWYLQRVDHFSYSNNDRFKMRYIISEDHWCGGCPIFFYAGNEGDIFMFANNTGFMWENAPKFRAMVIFAEHRYYGESLPYGQRSYKTIDKLGFLTTEQALADYADFIEYIKETIPNAEYSPVVTFGGSYGGMLAAWFRIKYPHITIGSLAASAPILQFPGIYKCNGYFDIVTNDFRKYSESCAKTIRNSWAAVRRLSTTVEGRQWLSNNFALCKTLEANQTDDFISWLSSTWENLAMIDYPNPASFLQPLPAYPIGVVCQHLHNPNQDDKSLLRDVYKGAAVFYNYTGQVKCNDVDVEAPDLGTDGWNFQACTEMVMPVCSNGKTDMFEDNPWNLTQFSNDCFHKYGVYADSEKALTMFGGRDISSASNIIFSNGLRDPWSAGGVMDTLSMTLIAIKIDGACHHEDLRPSGPNDPKALKDARNMEIEIIAQWVTQYYKSRNITYRMGNSF